MLVEKFGEGNNSKFAASIGTSEANIRNYINGTQPRTDILTAIAEKFGISFEWLLTGKGEMQKSASPDCGYADYTRLRQTTAPVAAECAYRYEVSTETQNQVPLLPVSAQGGPLNDFVQSVRMQDCEKITTPIRGIDFAMTVAGDSMSPEYPNGSMVLIKKVNEKAFLEWGKVHVLDTCNGSVIKRIAPGSREGYIRCISINPDPVYAPFEVPMSDIFGVYKVVLCMALK